MDKPIQPLDRRHTIH